MRCFYKIAIKSLITISICIGVISIPCSQPFTPQDTLRGSITPERAWWDLSYYHLDVIVNPADSTISGTNTIRYSVITPHNSMQIDLQPPMQITSVIQHGDTLPFQQNGNAWFISLNQPQVKGSAQEIMIAFRGKPPVSPRPPWIGAISWRKDADGYPFVATANQGDGASMWWPCKDHMYDEPDSMLISVTVPEPLMDVSNGRLRAIEQAKDGWRTFHWFVSNPISNYVVNINVARYAHFSETFLGEKGLLSCDYYVLPENLEKAKRHFSDASRTLEAFEYWFGPYPFYEDGYKLVEVPYPGMEHQSSVTYGNGYRNGYSGRDLSGTGWGLKFDFIIVHESGHEWFANNITYKDIADMWIHEGFTAYSECLFVEYHFGKAAGAEYVRGTRSNIKNDKPIIGHYHVNKSGSGDMYPKAANMLHMIRQIIDDDEEWRRILRGLNKEFYHQTVTTGQIEEFIIRESGIDFSKVFDQYLRTTPIPIFEYRWNENTLAYRWTNCVTGFNMPLKVEAGDKVIWLKPTSHWQHQTFDQQPARLRPDGNFYVAVMEIK